MSEVPAVAVRELHMALVGEGWIPMNPQTNVRESLTHALAAVAPLIQQAERQATADEIAAALDHEAERASGPIFTRALEHAAEIARRVGGGGGGGQ
jgi:hypothetical protein